MSSTRSSWPPKTNAEAIALIIAAVGLAGLVLLRVLVFCAVAIAVPLAGIWSVNVLFGASIPFTWKTVLAVFVAIAVARTVFGRRSKG